jgi:hypothetical protein
MIKKASYLQVSIMTIEDTIILALKANGWKSWWVCQKLISSFYHVQNRFNFKPILNYGIHFNWLLLLNLSNTLNTWVVLQFELYFILYINSFESNHTNFVVMDLSVYPLVLASSLPYSLDPHIHMVPTNAKWKLDFDGHKLNPKVIK